MSKSKREEALEKAAAANAAAGDDNRPEFIRMTHPAVEGEATAPRAAFEQVWEPRGWALAAGDPTVPAPGGVDAEPEGAVV